MTPLDRAARAIANVPGVLLSPSTRRSIARAVMNSIDEEELAEVIVANTFLADTNGKADDEAALIKDYLAERQAVCTDATSAE